MGRKALEVLYAIGLFIIITSVAGCFKKIGNESAADACISLCSSEKNKGTDLDKSPCLSDNIENSWVCDVAHSPRQSIDNLPENQCSAFREGKANHFVEVDKNCAIIRIS
jgi:hypothetical protein